MKIKLISTIIAGILVAGCGSDSDSDGKNPDSHTLQAFDPAIINMTVKYDCGENKTGTLTSRTAHSGKVTTKDENITADPSACSFTFTGDENTKDVTNGKSMDEVTYTIPKGLAQKDQLVTASPLTTYLAKTLNGAPFTEAAANDALVDLGLDGLVNNARISDVTAIFSNIEAVIDALPSNSKDRGTILATTMVLSDTLKSLPPGTPIDEIATVTKKITASVTTEYPFYPAVGTEAPTDEVIYLDVKETATDVQNDPAADVKLPVKVPAEPVPEETKPVPPPTGGTGGGNGQDPNG
ncbi:hypothetical protein [Photobacterium phosphoreum]|uniref:hypothetical protein n=1 Tax=Photobacterium phosphoreum TaxID=659 RepID=UPI0007F87B62|nr:hypothetical protein [Photobacterium phosphoreum]OBU38008.1 hypothetical protein AYY24_01825 [Photobacterium phosphoreum]PSW38845.1 hypothetical protein CTM87_00685 [Photobacterium phosphoreum]